MDNVMIFTLLFGGISIVLFLIACGLSNPPTDAGTEKPPKVVIYTYVTAIVFMIIAIIVFQTSSLTAKDLITTIMNFS